MDHDDHTLLIRIDERTQTIADAQNRAFASLTRQEKRIGSLERWRAWIVGALATLALVVTIALRLVP